VIPPIYAFSSLNFFGEIEHKYHYFQSARAALVFLLSSLEIDIVLIPSFTCPTVLDALKTLDIEYDFVDLDNGLDFDIKDLEFLLDFYNTKKIALLPTSLFNVKIRDYKKIYPKLIIIEDLTQSLPMYKQSSDFAIYSFGKSKFISSFGGGLLEGNIQNFKYDNLQSECTFLRDYFFSMIFQIFLKYEWNILYNFYKIQKVTKHTFLKIEPKKICDIKKRWICSLIKNFDSSYREKISQLYIEMIDKDKLFNFSKKRAYLRMPVKKRIISKEVSFMEAYHTVYEEAVKKRGKKLEVAECLANNCSFLPTHELVKASDVKRFARLVN